MLKGISPLINPELLMILVSVEHRDKIVLADNISLVKLIIRLKNS